MSFDINKVQEYFNKTNLSEEDKNGAHILISNEFGILSEVIVPEELLVYFKTASLAGTPGITETHQPELTD